MELQLYAVALRAWNRMNFNSLMADFVTALTQEDAERQAQNLMEETYPDNGWWHDQEVRVTLVPQDVLEYVLGVPKDLLK